MRIEKVEKLVANLCYSHKNLKTRIKSCFELVLKKVHRIVTFNQKPLRKSYIEIHTSEHRAEKKI